MSAAVRHQTGMGCCASTLSRAEDVRDLETGMILMNKQWIRCQDIQLEALEHISGFLLFLVLIPDEDLMNLMVLSFKLLFFECV